MPGRIGKRLAGGVGTALLITATFLSISAVPAVAASDVKCQSATRTVLGGQPEGGMIGMTCRMSANNGGPYTVRVDSLTLRRFSKEGFVYHGDQVMTNRTVVCRAYEWERSGGNLVFSGCGRATSTRSR
ncbi:hypothetical protein GCM10009544_02200 [Streptomyces stramineus]|uniref:Uncharacterized protein n=1 Tax=Streptomyces stramineus TaxID=173861 RepID=A0ABN0ZC76_9ACTN